MKKLSVLLSLSFTFFITSCSTTRAPSVNFLEIRSDYNGESNLKNLNTNALFVPKRTEPKQVDIYIHPHETVHGDYFRGGYIRSIVQGGQWELTENEEPLKQLNTESTKEPIEKPSKEPPHFLEHGSRR